LPKNSTTEKQIGQHNMTVARQTGAKVNVKTQPINHVSLSTAASRRNTKPKRTTRMWPVASTRENTVQTTHPSGDVAK